MSRIEELDEEQSHFEDSVPSNNPDAPKLPERERGAKYTDPSLA